jgi:hypothetical protein
MHSEENLGRKVTYSKRTERKTYFGSYLIEYLLVPIHW